MRNSARPGAREAGIVMDGVTAAIVHDRRARSTAYSVDRLGAFLREVGLAALAFDLASMFVGYVVPRLFRVERKQAVAMHPVDRPHRAPRY